MCIIYISQTIKDIDDLFKELNSSEKGEINLNSEWLACADICLPQSGSSKVNLNDVLISPIEDQPNIQELKDNLPKKYPYPISVSTKNNELILSRPSKFLESISITNKILLASIKNSLTFF